MPKTFPSLTIFVPEIDPLTGLTWIALLIADAALVQRVLISWPFVKISVIILFSRWFVLTLAMNYNKLFETINP